MLRTGRANDAEKNAKKVVEIIQKSGAKQIIVTCAGCLKTLRQDYPKLGLEIPMVLHVAEFLQEVVRAKKLELKPIGKGVKVTFHDPCHLARAVKVCDEPREILKAIPGVELVEMVTIRNAAMCCGAGGGLRSFDAELSKKLAADRVRSAEDVGAEIIATACPFCENNLNAGTEQIGSTIRVVDVVDLLAESLI